MSGVNKAILIGRLGKDPELRYTPGGDAVVNFSIATSEVWNDKNSGEKREKTEWHSIVAWRKKAELINQYFGKGDNIYIEGQLQTRSWEDEAGTRRNKTEIVAQNFAFVEKNRGSSGGSIQQPTPAPAGQDHQQGGMFGFSKTDPNDDIPF